MSITASYPPRAGAADLPALIGVIHLRALPGSPSYEGDVSSVASACARDAQVLADAGFDGVVVENYGDAPFEPGSVSPVTIAAMTRCALAARVAAPSLSLGINVLRNDAEAAIGIAVCVGASFVRVNVHIGARLTDQGLIEGLAHKTLRMRKALGASDIRLLCDVDVKHSAPLGPPRPIEQEVEDVAKRAMAEAVLVTGEGTGKSADLTKLSAVKRAAGKVPVLVASGATIASLPSLAPHADGVIVGSAIRRGGVAGIPIDGDLAKAFADAFRAVF